MKMINELSNKLEISIIDKKYIFHSLYFPLLFLTNIFKRRSTKIKAPKGFMRNIHRLLSYIQLMDYYIFPKYIFGTSIITIMKINR